jgi:hypothetical protein
MRGQVASPTTCGKPPFTSVAWYLNDWLDAAWHGKTMDEADDLGRSLL